MSNTEFEISNNEQHSITSKNVLCCNETGRVIAVFYNEGDLEKAEKLLNKNNWIPIEGAKLNHGERYLIKLPSGRVNEAKFFADESFESFEDSESAHFSVFETWDAWDLCDIKYYQPLPESKK